MKAKDQSHLTPSEVVSALDRYVVGQDQAKKAVAIALRNRWRRQNVDSDLRDEIHPKNILMIGPTGVGKTEIARRLARLADAPFVKVEATKYTEVGYVGKDVESMVRDLVETAITMVKTAEQAKVAGRARESAEERVLDLLVPETSTRAQAEAITPLHGELSTREKFRGMLKRGELNDREVQIDTQDVPTKNFEVFALPGMEDMENNLRDMIGNLVPKKSRRRKTKVLDALRILEQEEAQKLVDMDRVVPVALERAQQRGIIFIDEMDKVAVPDDSYRGGGPSVSREGVQRDLLPIVEGTTVNTKYGPVKTDHVLFIAAGAFHHAKPSDLIPELQGRFPIRVELKSLTTEDFVRILKEPKNSLLRQYEALLDTEGVSVVFRDDAIQTICERATAVNESTENIGARRLHTILERVMEEISFTANQISGQTVEITSGYVNDRVAELAQNSDLSRYIL
jgi:ATP-dependent HslUV protease ATP-binding subunit HslU